MKNLILILTFCATSLYLFPQGDELPGSSFRPTSSRQPKGLELPSELKSKANIFFNHLLDSNVTDAYEDLMRGSFIFEKKDKIKTLISQTHRAFDIYGPLKGFELVNIEEVTASFVRIRFLGKHSRFPMRWIFTFYKSPDQGWIITNVKFDDLTELFFADE